MVLLIMINTLIIESLQVGKHKLFLNMLVMFSNNILNEWVKYL